MAALASSCGGRGWRWNAICCDAEEGGKAVLTFEQMKELIVLVAEHRLGGVEVERSGFRFKVEGSRAAAGGAPAAAGASATAADAALAPMASMTPLAPMALMAPMTPGLAAAAGGEGGALASLPAAAAAPPQGLPVHAGELAAPALPGTAGKAATAADQQAHILNSPIVGTFYRAPAPEAPAFVEVGDRVRVGQVLCIIEAMKLMNEIESDVDGTIAQIYPQNSQAVEFGEPLFAIRTA
jgi:acetyl-CoA carboxylase biotin carboxyl carrier protein